MYVGRVDVHEQRDQRDDEEHHHREAVDLDADAELDAAVLPPGDVVHDRRDDGLARAAALGAEARRAPSAREPARVTAVGVLDALDPLDDARRTTSTNDAPTATMPISAPFSASASRRTGSAKNETAGISGMSQA